MLKSTANSTPFPPSPLSESPPASLDLLSATLPTVTPSEVARFWASKWTRRPNFTTPEFAGQFGLSTREAQAVILGYVDEGLLSYAGLEQGIESWQLSREGYAVLRPRAKRLTKKDVAQAKAVLASLPLAQGLELSLGGRPVFGKPNGTLLIGVRLRRVPYAETADGGLFSQIYEALRPSGLQSYCTIFLFDELVPHRLRHRHILQNDSWVYAECEPHKLDFEEKVHIARFSEFVKSKGVVYSPELLGMSFKVIPGMPTGSGFYVENFHESAKLPVECRRSDVVVRGSTAQRVEACATEWAFQYELERASSYYGGPDTEKLAELDYAVTTGSFDEYCATIEDLHVFGLSNFDKSDLQFQLLAVLERWRRDIRKYRTRYDEQKKEKRPPAEFRYEAVFDCLNFEPPWLVGFIRVPRATEAGWTALCDLWDSLLRRSSGTAGRAISDEGWCAGALSLFRRAATEAEIAAFDALSKQAEATLKAVFFGDDECLGLPVKQRYTQLKLGRAPTVLAKAPPPSPVIPKILRGSTWQLRRSTGAIFDAFMKLDSTRLTLVRNRLIDSEKVLMSDFVQRAAVPRGTDPGPVVLATGLRDAWSFSVSDRGWSATLDAVEWCVKLESLERQLFLEMSLEGLSRRVSLSSKIKTRKPSETEYLSALLAFMDKLKSVSDVGYANWEQEWRPRTWGGLTGRTIR